MSIKRDKKTVKVITILSGILFFGLVMGIVIFSLPDTKRGKTDKDESVAESYLSNTSYTELLLLYSGTISFIFRTVSMLSNFLAMSTSSSISRETSV